MLIPLSSTDLSSWPFIQGMNRTVLLVKLLAALMVAAAMAVPVAAQAAESNRFVSREDTVSIVSKSDSINGTTLRLGLLFRLSKGWHIYWKDAGDAGSPPELALTRPAGATAGTFDWPAPDWLVTNALGNYVVNGTVLLPFAVSLPQAVPAQGVDLVGDAHWLV
jgi:DsbC/DsbD-like thiol-disulfide interchange protein